MVDQVKDFVFGLVTTTIANVVVYPIDLVKSKLQGHAVEADKVSTPRDFITHRMKTQGLRSFWSGYMVNTLCVAPTRATGFMVTYWTYNQMEQPNFFLAGAVGGFFQTFIQCPTDTIKLRSMFKENRVFYSPFQVLPRVVPRALPATVCRDTLGGSVYYGLFGSLHEEHGVFTSALLSSSVAALVATPFDCLNTQIQTSTMQKTFVNLPASIRTWLSSGVLTGVGFRMVRSSLQGMIFLTGVHALKH